VNNPRWQASFPWTAQVNDTNHRVFGNELFRTNQESIINATMSGKDCFVLMPTGGGKSLCYQLPAVLESNGLTLVISPLVSLIQDQVAQLKLRDVRATYLVSSLQDLDQSSEITRTLENYQLLYVTPEKLVKSDYLRNRLTRLKIPRIVFDEAHCVSQWGHDFRPDYKQVGQIVRTTFPLVPILALTATATDRVRVDVMSQLQISGAEIFLQSFNRPNLHYEVRTKRKSIVTEIVNFVHTQYPGESGIVYCFSKKDCEEVAQQINREGIPCGFYHADISPEDKHRTYEAWISGSIRIVTATIAFGMGINKADVRFVIHHTLSKSLEGYYQVPLHFPTSLSHI
jgi:RecQ family ATP-dependent DNA helicase